MPIRRQADLARAWPWVALLACLGALGTAHGFERFADLAPCHLCLKQREVYWAGAAVALVSGGLGLLPMARGLVRPGNALLFVVFAFGCGLAAYHAGVEWKMWPGPAGCTVGGALSVNAGDLAKLLKGQSLGMPLCDKAAWVFLGLSMAGWNAILSLGLAIASLSQALPLARRSGLRRR